MPSAEERSDSKGTPSIGYVPPHEEDPANEDITAQSDIRAYEQLPARVDESSDEEDWFSDHEIGVGHNQGTANLDTSPCDGDRINRDNDAHEAAGTREGANPLKPPKKDPPGAKAIATLNQGALERCKRRMLAGGRCPHQVNYFSKLYDLKTLRYLSRMKALPPREGIHAQCAEHDTCVAFNTDEMTYQQRHVCEQRDCALVSVPQDSLARIIRSGKTPLLSIDLTDGLNPTLSIWARTSRTKYIAISHVWADGLGNPLQCALPSCQMKLLSSRLSQARKSLYDDAKLKEVSRAGVLDIDL